jgi:C-terminal processing protease CtpA/Prc
VPSATPIPATATPIPATPTPESLTQISGEIELSNAFVLDVYFYQRFVLLEDLTGFIQRDFEYELPLESQIIGPVNENEDGSFSYQLSLPAKPLSPLNDVDNDGGADTGLMVWQVAMWSNIWEDPFLREDETGGWSAYYSSAKVDSENKNEIVGGKLLVWAPDAEQQFPSGFGTDGLLFTADDPASPVPLGYSMIDLSAEPFVVSQPANADMKLYEGELTVNDFSEMSWSEAFDALHQKISAEYPFTELKGLDWDALYAEFSPRIAQAEKDKDAKAYYLALRDYSWSIPDGHVGLSGGDDFGLFQEETNGGYGFAITPFSDGRVIAHIVLPEGPATEAGILQGAEILTWNGEPVNDAVAKIVPWSSPFSNQEAKEQQQYRYLLRSKVGTTATVTFKNPGETAEKTAELTSIEERQSFAATSAYAGFDSIGLPVQYEILDSGYGYVKITSLSEDISLIIRLWERAIQVFVDNEVPGIIVDMRQNGGGSPLGSFFASYFTTETIDLYKGYYYSEKSGEFETFGPGDQIEPNEDLNYSGAIAVLVSTACASACEDVSYALAQLPQTTVVGFTSTNGIFGEVARGQYLLPEGYNFQIPTGMSLTADGEVVIEGPGVVPDVRVPRDETTMINPTGDVVLDTAVAVLSAPANAGVKPEGNPTLLSPADSEQAINDGADLLESYADESYENASVPGETYLFNVNLSKTPVLWAYGWCAADEATLKSNFENIELTFTLNGEAVGIEQFANLDFESGGQSCRYYLLGLTDFPAGEHLLTTTITFTNPINDGLADYPAGTMVYEYHVFSK